MCLSIAKKHYFPKLPKHKEPPGELVTAMIFIGMVINLWLMAAIFLKSFFHFCESFFFFNKN